MRQCVQCVSRHCRANLLTTRLPLYRTNTHPLGTRTRRGNLIVDAFADSETRGCHRDESESSGAQQHGANEVSRRPVCFENQ